jgi:predicted DNA-binding transcriptional regulator YafY
VPEYVALVVQIQRALRAKRWQAAALARKLKTGQRTVERILAALAAAGEPVKREKEGKEVFYSLEQ